MHKVEILKDHFYQSWSQPFNKLLGRKCIQKNETQLQVEFKYDNFRK